MKLPPPDPHRQLRPDTEGPATANVLADARMALTRRSGPELLCALSRGAELDDFGASEIGTLISTLGLHLLQLPSTAPSSTRWCTIETALQVLERWSDGESRTRTLNYPAPQHGYPNFLGQLLIHGAPLALIEKALELGVDATGTCNVQINPTTVIGGISALHLALRIRYVGAAQLLLARGATTVALDQRGNNCLHALCSQDRPLDPHALALLEQLLELRVSALDLNRDRQTPWQLMLAHGDSEALRATARALRSPNQFQTAASFTALANALQAGADPADLLNLYMATGNFNAVAAVARLLQFPDSRSPSTAADLRHALPALLQAEGSNVTRSVLGPILTDYLSISPNLRRIYQGPLLAILSHLNPQDPLMQRIARALLAPTTERLPEHLPHTLPVTLARIGSLTWICTALTADLRTLPGQSHGSITFEPQVSLMEEYGAQRRAAMNPLGEPLVLLTSSISWKRRNPAVGWIHENRAGPWRIEFGEHCLSIGHPSLGLLVVRNSDSPVACRLLPEVAYWTPRYGSGSDGWGTRTPASFDASLAAIKASLLLVPAIQGKIHDLAYVLSGAIQAFFDWKFDTTVDPETRAHEGRGAEQSLGFTAFLTRLEAQCASAQAGNQPAPTLLFVPRGQTGLSPYRFARGHGPERTSLSADARLLRALNALGEPAAQSPDRGTSGLQEFLETAGFAHGAHLVTRIGSAVGGM